MNRLAARLRGELFELDCRIAEWMVVRAEASMARKRAREIAR